MPFKEECDIVDQLSKLVLDTMMLAKPPLVPNDTPTIIRSMS